MRISYFAPRCTPDSSHGRYVIELARRFGPAHSVTVYSGVFWPPLATFAKCRRLPVPGRPALARLVALWATSTVASKTRRADILHNQGADAPIGNVVTAQFCSRTMKGIAGRGSGMIRKLNYAVGEAAEQYCMTKPSTRRIIAVSRSVKNEIEREYGVDPSKVVVIHHGVDLNAFNPALKAKWRALVRNRLLLREDEFVVLFVGGDYRRKGLLSLVRAVSALESAVKVVAVEVKPDHSLLEILKRERLEHLVSFVDSTSDIAPLYAAADCFALPTRYDTFSMATLEAMAMGLPVVVSREAGVTELVTSGRDCLVLEDSSDVSVLAQLLTRLAEDDALRSQLGTEARKTAERHSWDSVAAQTLNVYEEILGGAKS